MGVVVGRAKLIMPEYRNVHLPGLPANILSLPMIHLGFCHLHRVCVKIDSNINEDELINEQNM